MESAVPVSAANPRGTTGGGARAAAPPARDDSGAIQLRDSWQVGCFRTGASGCARYVVGISGRVCRRSQTRFNLNQPSRSALIPALASRNDTHNPGTPISETVQRWREKIPRDAHPPGAPGGTPHTERMASLVSHTSFSRRECLSEGYEAGAFTTG